jgi:hypothetical protein
VEETAAPPRSAASRVPCCGCVLAPYAAGLAIGRRDSDVLLVDIAGGIRYRATAPVGLATGAPERVAGLLGAEVRRALAAAPQGAERGCPAWAWAVPARLTT